MKAVVMAAGAGTRLRPLTYGIPKPLLPIAGRPVIDYAIDNVLTCKKIDEIIVNVSYMRDQVENYLKHTRDGVTIRVIQTLAWDTGGDLKAINMEYKFNEPFVVAYGDNMTDINVGELVKTHERHGDALATDALFGVPLEEVHKFGVVKYDEVTEKIHEFVEKPTRDKAPSNLVNAGHYVLTPEALGRVPFAKVKIEHSIFPELAREGKLYGYHAHPKVWVDIGSMDSYMKAHKLAETLLPPD